VRKIKPGVFVLLICLGGSGAAEVPGAVPGPMAKAPVLAFDLDLANPEVRTQIERQGGSIVSEGPDGIPAVRISNESGKALMLVTFPIGVDPVRGAKLSMTAMIRGEGVEPLNKSVALRSYEGVKFQLFADSPVQGPKYFDSRNLRGTFPWRSTGRIASIPDDATKCAISLGIEKAGGTAWFSNVRVQVLQEKPDRPSVPANPGSNPVTRLRGVMSPQVFSKKDFDDLVSWNANLIRWQMWQHSTDKTPYNDWLDSELNELAQVLDAAKERGIKVVVDLHSPPGGRLPDGTMRMFLEKEFQEEFIRNWEKIARRFKGHPAIWGYDLINEPVQTLPSPEGLGDWLGIQVLAGQAVRAIDPLTPVIIETDEWNSPESFKWLKPVNIARVIYQAHMYWPGEFTHQGVRTDQGVAKDANSDQAVPYPGTHAGRPLDKEALRRYLAPVREFQLAYGVPIYIGEFSAIRWAPGAARYLDDCISIFEEYGWDWTYHAFREWEGWSVEHADLPRDRTNHPKATGPTDRQQVLLKWLKLNVPLRP